MSTLLYQPYSPYAPPRESSPAAFRQKQTKRIHVDVCGPAPVSAATRPPTGLFPCWCLSSIFHRHREHNAGGWATRGGRLRSRLSGIALRVSPSSLLFESAPHETIGGKSPCAMYVVTCSRIVAAVHCGYWYLKPVLSMAWPSTARWLCASSSASMYGVSVVLAMPAALHMSCQASICLSLKSSATRLRPRAFIALEAMLPTNPVDMPKISCSAVASVPCDESVVSARL
mmetsp:Transcript_38908/g.102543  ORF Transcript_38908/g.102543 Transcript_38908/m.102543 type:complete len:229 (+) Transcript_38908:137-823(+)